MAASDGERSISTILLKNSRLWTVYSSLGTAAPSPHARVVGEGAGGLYTGYKICLKWKASVLLGDGSNLREKIQRRTSSRVA